MTNATLTHAVPPSWYPDPSSEDQWRWWSGDSWTDHVSPRVEASVVEASVVEQAVIEPAVVEQAVVEPVVATPAATTDALPMRRARGPVRVDETAGEVAATRVVDQPWTVATVSTDGTVATDATVATVATDGHPGAIAAHRADIESDLVNTWVAPSAKLSASTSPVWAIAFSPLVAVIALVAITFMIDLDPLMVYAAMGIAVLAVLLYVAFTVRDYRRLLLMGFEHPASSAWGILGPLVYLVVRTIRVRSEARHGSVPLWAFLANGVIATALLAGLPALGVPAPALASLSLSSVSLPPLDLSDITDLVSGPDAAAPSALGTPTNDVEVLIQTDLINRGETSIVLCPDTAVQTANATFTCSLVDAATPTVPGTVTVTVGADGSEATFTVE